MLLVTTMLSVSGKYTECKPLFIEDQDLVVIASGSVLQLVSMETGQHLGNLRGHTSNISSLCPHHELKSHILSTDLGGVIVVWDFINKKEVARCDTGSYIHEMISYPCPISAGLLLPKEVLLVQGSADTKNIRYVNMWTLLLSLNLLPQRRIL